VVRLTDLQVLAAAAQDRLVNIVSAPGSGKTTVAAERFGYLRYGTTMDRRGVIGVSFTRSAAGELGSRIASRWGSSALSFPHVVSTFDEFHVRLLHSLLSSGSIHWPDGLRKLTVLDEYRGCPGYRWLVAGSWRRVARLGADRTVYSDSVRVTQPRNGIGNVGQHRDQLRNGIVSHEDVRSVLLSTLRVPSLMEHAQAWMGANYRGLIIDEVYDADPLDLAIAGIATNAGLDVTLIGDPWQALYGWRGATPENVAVLLGAAPFVQYDQPESFRFEGDQMPALAKQLRAGQAVTIPAVSSTAVAVALARRWRELWHVGDNVLPLAFRNVANGIDAMLNLLLDQATRACLGRRAFGRQSAQVQLGLDDNTLDERQADVLAPILQELVTGRSAAEVLGLLRDAALVLGARRRPNRLPRDGEPIRQLEVEALRRRLGRQDLIPGLTVHQAKGCEWQRVGVALRRSDLGLLSRGLRELEPEDCVVYVALTRARRMCGWLGGADQLPLNVDDATDASGV
jgi:DNA helicase-2/ATP-dependent DNA helicase PcrA